MSRSFKKPYHSITCSGARAGMQKKWKKDNNDTLRHIEDEKIASSPSFYKKVNDSWSAPNDGKTYNPECKKAHRK
jgi:hypothetical protein